MYIKAVSNNTSIDPATLRLLHCKYKPFALGPIKEPTVFYGVRLSHVPGVYTSRKDAKPHTVGILKKNDFKRFEARKKEEEYVAQVITLGQPPLPFPDVVLHTDGSASHSSATAGSGVHAHRSDNYMSPHCGDSS